MESDTKKRGEQYEKIRLDISFVFRPFWISPLYFFSKASLANFNSMSPKRIFLTLNSKLLLILIAFLFISSCSTQKTYKIALSKGKGSESYESYSKWIKAINPSIETIDLYFLSKEEAIKVLEQCNGLLLTGGPDVEPSKYGKPADTARCEIDLKRDSLEFELIRLAEKMNLPTLGICRGMQILNVAFGGNLIVDIPEDWGTKVRHRCEHPESCFHDISVDPNTLLNEITGVFKEQVNTNHHQAVNVPAPAFVITARSNDGIAEALEWKEPNDKPFLIAVQWHPERLPLQSKMSFPIGSRFIQEVIKFGNSVKK